MCSLLSIPQGKIIINIDTAFFEIKSTHLRYGCQNRPFRIYLIISVIDTLGSTASETDDFRTKGNQPTVTERTL